MLIAVKLCRACRNARSLQAGGSFSPEQRTRTPTSALMRSVNLAGPPLARCPAATSFPSPAIGLSVSSGQVLSTRERRSLPAETRGLREVVQTSTKTRARCLASVLYGRIFVSVSNDTTHLTRVQGRCGDAGTIGCCFRVTKSVDGEQGQDFVHLNSSVHAFRPSHSTCLSWDLTPAERVVGNVWRTRTGETGNGTRTWGSPEDALTVHHAVSLCYGINDVQSSSFRSCVPTGPYRVPAHTIAIRN
ncbi:hypothetical protein C8T65DRAFT_20538 [Cerioporus squamosus]|nr:hypothetical protein C8T65DRAFT_20538 [Cerioporus squamosus]